MLDIYKIKLDTLVFEITRRCNMSCAHCLRGDAQNLDITEQVIDETLNQVESINCIIFTGGEISLNWKAIQYILDKCKKNNIIVYNFYAVTNGKEVPIQFIYTMLNWYAYCLECGGEGQFSTLALSSDMYHENIPQHNIDLLRGLSFFNVDDKAQDFNKLSVINEGRATRLENIKKRDISHYDPGIYVEDFYDCSSLTVEKGIIYITANGDVRTECDAAYDNHDYTIMNIMENKLLGNELRNRFYEKED